MAKWIIIRGKSWYDTISNINNTTSSNFHFFVHKFVWSHGFPRIKFQVAAPAWQGDHEHNSEPTWKACCKIIWICKYVYKWHITTYICLLGLCMYAYVFLHVNVSSLYVFHWSDEVKGTVIIVHQLSKSLKGWGTSIYPLPFLDPFWNESHSRSWSTTQRPVELFLSQRPTKSLFTPSAAYLSISSTNEANDFRMVNHG